MNGGNCQHGVGKGFAAHFEIPVLVERGAGGRQQHSGLAESRSSSSIAGGRQNLINAPPPA
jgi:hypothetical protein